MWMPSSEPCRALSGEHGPEPRLVRIVSCPLGPGQRRGVLRRVSFPLQHGHRSAPPLDSRRLADRASGSCRGFRDRMPGALPIRSPACRSGRSSTIFGAVWSRSRCCSCCWATGCSSRSSVVSGRGSSSRSSRFPDCCRRLVELLRKPEELPWAMHLRGVGRIVRTPTRPDLAHPGVPALRRLRQPGCHRADAGALAGDAQTASGMANLQ